LSLKGFSYLRNRRILKLFMMLVLSSMLFSITGLSLLGFYKNFDEYLGEENDIVVVYASGSSTPYTGYVPAYLSERISQMEGVLASSSEMIIPCFIEDEAIFLRGIVPEDFTKLNEISMIAGDPLEIRDINYLIVGYRLAERLDLRTGEHVLILGVLRDRYLELQVKGIYKSNTMIDDEVLAPLYAGQWLRGAGYNRVTLIRFKIDRSKVNPSMIFDEVEKESEKPSPGLGEGTGLPEIIPSQRASINIEDIAVEEAQRFMNTYLERYGITREALLILSVMVFIFSSASIVTASNTIMSQHGAELELLQSLGASTTTLKWDILMKLLPWSLASSTIGIIISLAALTVLNENGFLLALSHRFNIQVDPNIAAINFILVSLLLSIIILRSDLKHMRG